MRRFSGIWQVFEHMSLSTMLPSSHASTPAWTMLSPHLAASQVMRHASVWTMSPSSHSSTSAWTIVSPHAASVQSPRHPSVCMGTRRHPGRRTTATRPTPSPRRRPLPGSRPTAATRARPPGRPCPRRSTARSVHDPPTIRSGRRRARAHPRRAAHRRRGERAHRPRRKTTALRRAGGWSPARSAGSRAPRSRPRPSAEPGAVEADQPLERGDPDEAVPGERDAGRVRERQPSSVVH